MTITGPLVRLSAPVADLLSLFFRHTASKRLKCNFITVRGDTGVGQLPCSFFVFYSEKQSF